MYSEQIQRFYDVFPKEQIMIVLFDDLSKDNNKLIKSIHNFLGIEEVDIEENTKHNAAFVPKNPKINRLITKSGVKNFVSDIVSDNIKDKMKSMIYSKDDIPELSDADKEYLKEIYKEDILKTSKLINMDLSHWLDV